MTGMTQLVRFDVEILITDKEEANGGPPTVSEPHSDAWLHKVFDHHSLAVVTGGKVIETLLSIRDNPSPSLFCWQAFTLLSSKAAITICLVRHVSVRQLTRIQHLSKANSSETLTRLVERNFIYGVFCHLSSCACPNLFISSDSRLQSQICHSQQTIRP